MRNLGEKAAVNYSNPLAARVFAMAFLDLETRPMFLHNDIGNFQWDDELWYGLPDLGQVSPVIEDGTLTPGLFNVSLNGIRPEWIADARAERHTGRQGIVYFASRDLATGEFDGDPEVITDGTMQDMSIQVGSTNASISLRIEDGRALFRKNPNLWFANDAHQAEHPGDLFFSLQSKTARVRYTWGERGTNPYTGAGPGTGYGQWGFGSGFGLGAFR